ncbi:MAG: hypothetical protein JKX75_07300, partial [Gammaproteobacteria bacterium]|nr:hypothetical protein [Gammaproteobacteria bacterium]
HNSPHLSHEIPKRQDGIRNTGSFNQNEPPRTDHYPTQQSENLNPANSDGQDSPARKSSGNSNQYLFEQNGSGKTGNRTESKTKGGHVLIEKLFVDFQTTNALMRSERERHILCAMKPRLLNEQTSRNRLTTHQSK